MNSYLIGLCIIFTTIFFHFKKYSAKQLNEKGVSSLGILYLQKQAIYPAIIIFLLFFEKEYINKIFEEPLILCIFLLFAILWPIQEFLSLYLVKSSNSLANLTLFMTLINLPLYLLGGLLINNDVPNAYSLVGIAILLIAFSFRPQKNKNNEKINLFVGSFFLILGVSVLNKVLEVIDNGLYRYLLENSEYTVFVMSISTILILLPVNLFFIFKKLEVKEYKILSNKNFLIYSIPTYWFLGTITEAFGYNGAPIFIFQIIASFAFLMDVFSDIKNKRILLDLKTYVFVLLVLLGIMVGIFSLG